MIYVTLNNVETLKFSNGTTSVNLSTLFDTVAPTLISQSPADKSTDVALSSNLTLTFSESIKLGTASLLLKNAAGSVIESYSPLTSTNLSVSGAVLTINPTQDLDPGNSYFLEIPSGAVTDLSGNAYTGNTTYNFKTVSLNHPPTGSLTLDGIPTQGQQLIAKDTLTDIDGMGPILYSWKADGQDITGAHGSTYVLLQSEVGKSITLTASYTDLQGHFETVNSASTMPVGNINDQPSGNVVITGLAIQGQRLTANQTLSDLDGLGAIQYQWLADGTTINGATTSTYILSASDVGKAISVTANYIDLEGTFESVLSAPTALVVEGKGLTGMVRDKEHKASLTGASLTLGSSSTNVMSDGYFEIMDTGAETTPTLLVIQQPAPTNKVQAGITLSDVLCALKVYLNKQLPAGIENPYKYVAADFQGDGDVDLADVLSLLKYYLEKPVNYQPQWVFTDTANQINGLPASAQTGYVLDKDHAMPAPIIIDPTNTHQIDIVGVLRGDVDGSFG